MGSESSCARSLMRTPAAVNASSAPSLLSCPHCLRSRLVLLHFLAKAERAHIGPNFADISETFLFRTCFALLPTTRYLDVRWPKRVLLFMIYEHFVYWKIIFFVAVHFYSPRCTGFLFR